MLEPVKLSLIYLRQYVHWLSLGDIHETRKRGIQPLSVYTTYMGLRDDSNS